MSEHVAHRQAIRLGRTVKLTCPVEGDPPALIMWTKDGRNIHSGWSRFRVLPFALRIKAVETEDAGTYVCKAANGFGSVNINYTLIVIGKEPSRCSRDVFHVQSSPRLCIAYPLTPPTPLVRTYWMLSLLALNIHTYCMLYVLAHKNSTQLRVASYLR